MATGLGRVEDSESVHRKGAEESKEEDRKILASCRVPWRLCGEGFSVRVDFHGDDGRAPG
jgi:hypothetical protein